MIDDAQEFGARLSLALKLLNISRGTLASAARADKSLVSRWARGMAAPRGPYLAVLTEIVRARVPGFSQLSWNLSLDDFARLLGGVMPLTPSQLGSSATDSARAESLSDGDSVSFPPELIASARRETLRRGESFEGFYQMTHPSATRLGQFLSTQLLIHRQAGLLHARWGGGGYECLGNLFLIMGQLYGFLVDTSDDTILFLVMNGVNMPRVEVMDGIIVTNAKDGPQTPTAFPFLVERTGELLSTRAECDAEFEKRKSAANFVVDPAQVGEDVRAHLLRNVGPAAALSGIGEMLLRLPNSQSWSRGGTLHAQNKLQAVEGKIASKYEPTSNNM